MVDAILHRYDISTYHDWSICPVMRFQVAGFRFQMKTADALLNPETGTLNP
jgi:hypothetical protein